MIATVLRVVVAVSIALVGGAFSLRYVLDRGVEQFGEDVSGWRPRFTEIGGTPYSRARTARSGDLPIGPSEGLLFVAERDASGRPLSRDCHYLIGGKVPPARFWTLHSTGARPAPDRPAALHSWSLLREENGGFAITAGPDPQPGNWLAVGEGGRLSFVLTLYDTSLAASTGVGDIELPRITGSGCRG